MDSVQLEKLLNGFVSEINSFNGDLRYIEIHGGKLEDRKQLCAGFQRIYKSKKIVWCHEKSSREIEGDSIYRIDVGYFENHKSRVS